MAMPAQRRLAQPQQLISLLQAGLLAAMAAVLRLLPLRAALALTGEEFGLVGIHTGKAKKVRGSYAVAFPERSPAEHEALLRSSFRYVGATLVELVHLGAIWRDRDRRIEFVLAEGAKPLAAGVPTVIVSAHVGAWEAIPLIGPYYGVTMPIIYAPAKNPYIDALMRYLRRANGCPLVASDGAVRKLVRALSQGQCIGSVLDMRHEAGELLPFFDEPARTSTIAARLALRFNCDMVPVKAARLPGGRYRVTILPPLKPLNIYASADEQARNMTMQANRLFEGWITENPGQWYCLKRRWPRKTVARCLDRVDAS